MGMIWCVIASSKLQTRKWTLFLDIATPSAIPVNWLVQIDHEWSDNCCIRSLSCSINYIVFLLQKSEYKKCIGMIIWNYIYNGCGLDKEMVAWMWPEGCDSNGTVANSVTKCGTWKNWHASLCTYNSSNTVWWCHTTD